MPTLILDKIFSFLKENPVNRTVFIPSVWKNGPAGRVSKINFGDYLITQIEEILSHRKPGLDYRLPISATTSPAEPKDWTKNASVYNLLVRLAASFDLDGDGYLGSPGKDTTLTIDGLRETGTFLKIIALLPYIKSLGINTLHLLPVTPVGQDGRKGDLGSPYAIKNHNKPDPLLADSLINFSPEDQLKALVEAAHILNMRVVLEFVLRTASKDADLVKEHPEWFYWIDAEVGAEHFKMPEYKLTDLKKIKKIPEGKGEYLPPPQSYTAIFTQPPAPETVVMEGNKWVGTSEGKKVEIPGAFADWPPDDVQPPWRDVTYLRLFEHQQKDLFNYIAYDTIRYYNPQLQQTQNINTPVWDYLTNVIPHYQKHYGIDGVLLDMGHALPAGLRKAIINKTRQTDPCFAVWDENFDIKKETRDEGYNAVVGAAWLEIYEKNGLIKFCNKVLTNLPLPIFGGPETHNSPRAAYKANPDFLKTAWLLFNTLPNLVPFLHNGFELLEEIPVNTGLGFKRDEVQKFSALKLPLFFKNNLNWLRPDNLIDFIRLIGQFRQQRTQWISEYNKEATLIPNNMPDKLICFRRHNPKNPTDYFWVVINADAKKEIPTEQLPEQLMANPLTDIITGNTMAQIAEQPHLNPEHCLLLVP